jgi:hypothetical protein
VAMAYVDYDPSQWRLYSQLEIQLQQEGNSISFHICTCELYHDLNISTYERVVYAKLRYNDVSKSPDLHICE